MLRLGMGQPDCAAGSASGSGTAGGFPARGEFSMVQANCLHRGISMETKVNVWSNLYFLSL